MFEIGFWELVMVAVVALIVVGPEKLPGLARTAGFWLGKARRLVAEVKADEDREWQLDELKESGRQQANRGRLQGLSEHVKSLERDIQAEFNDPGPPPGWRPSAPTDPPPIAIPGPAPTAAAPIPAPVQLSKNDPKPADPPVPPLPPADPSP